MTNVSVTKCSLCKIISTSCYFSVYTNLPKYYIQKGIKCNVLIHNQFSIMTSPLAWTFADPSIENMYVNWMIVFQIEISVKWNKKDLLIFVQKKWPAPLFKETLLVSSCIVKLLLESGVEKSELYNKSNFYQFIAMQVKALQFQWRIVM